MAAGIPEASIACYLIFFASKDDGAASVAMALKLIVGAGVGILLGLVFLMASADEPILRLALMIVFTFAGMFFAQASSLGPIASTVGFVLALAVTAFDIVPIPELLVRGLFYLWEVIATPMLVLIVVSALAAPRATDLLRRTVVARLRATAQALRGRPSARARELLGPDAAKTRERRKTAYLFSSGRQRLEALLDASYEALAVAVATGARDPALAVRLNHLAEAVATDQEGQGLALTPRDPALAAPLQRLARAFAADGAFSAETRKEPLLAPDAFTNPDYARFALKTTLAAFACYVLYTSLDWFGIHTAMVTCYFVALGSLGETLHKLTLRIVGCLIGAALGVATILLLMPEMTDIGHLVLVVGAVSLLAGWIALGSERVSYMGWQIALAFYLCTLDTFGPSFDLVHARDRIVGILIGNLAMTIVFSNLWPIGVAAAAGRAGARAAGALADILRQGASAYDLERFHVALANARRVARLKRFEARHGRLDDAEVAWAERGTENLEALAAPIVTLAEARQAGDLDDYLTPQAAAVAQAFEAAAASRLEATAARLDGGSGSATTAEIPPPDAWLAAAPFPPAPMSAIFAAGRRLDLYREIASRAERMAAEGERV